MSEIKGTEHSFDHLLTVGFSELPVDLQQAILARMREEKAIFSASSYAKNTATTHEASIYNLSPENAWAALELPEKRQLLKEAIQLQREQQKQREEKHPIREPAARPDPVSAEADRQFEGILEALDDALKRYTPTINVWPLRLCPESLLR